MVIPNVFLMKEGSFMTKILISGYYGFDNAGDDAVLYGIISSLKKIDPNVHLNILSNQVEKTSQLFDIPTYDRWSLLEIIKQIMRADLVILGGGTLLQDRTSPRSPLYYLGITFFSKLFRKPVLYYGQGFGPIVHPFSKIMIKLIVNHVDAITVRDKHSAEEIRSYGVTKAPIYTTADPALTIDPREANKEEARELLRSYHIDLEKPIAYVAIRDWKNEQNYKKEIAKACDYVVRKGWQIVFLTMQNQEDLTPSLDILLQMEENGVVIEQPLNFKEIMGLIGVGQLMIGMRLHAIILSALLDVPFLPISYDPKIDRFAESFNKFAVENIQQIKADQLITEIDQIISHLPEQKKIIKEMIPSIIEVAAKSADIVFDVLKKKG